MKITVWTMFHLERKPKCIFVGESDFLPRIGDLLVCRDGFGAERVTTVFLNLVDKTAEIHVATTDPQNDYGPSLIE